MPCRRGAAIAIFDNSCQANGIGIEHENMLHNIGRSNHRVLMRVHHKLETAFTYGGEFFDHSFEIDLFQPVLGTLAIDHKLVCLAKSLQLFLGQAAFRCEQS